MSRTMFTLTQEETESVHALIHDWIWMFQGDGLMTPEHGRRLRRVYDLIEFYHYDLEDEGA